MKKNDIILFGIVLILSLASFVGIKWFQTQNETGMQVIIKDNGVVLKTFPFTEKTDELFEFEEDGEINKVVIKEGQVTVTEANCRDQICVKSQSISKNGEIIVCLPHKFTVEIYSEDTAEDDLLDSIAD